MQKPNVLYDSTWPVEQQQIRGKHGGLRYAEEVLNRLSLRDEIEIYYGINKYDIVLFGKLQNYIRERYQKGREYCANHMGNKIALFSDRVHNALKRRGINISSQNKQLFNEKVLNKINIYYSPVSAIPELINQKKSITPFFTALDLMPFIRPDLAPPSFGEFLKPAYDSIIDRTIVIAISEATKQDLLSYRPDLSPDRVIVNYLAGDETVFYENKDAGMFMRLKDKFDIQFDNYILCLNRVQKYKNTQLVLDGYKKIIDSKAICDVGLIVVGHFDTIENKEMMKNYFRDYNVKFIDYVEDQDLSVLYSNAICFAYMSFFEGFGLPILEAMMCGCPVICSDAKSIPEVIGDAGICIPPNDLDLFCDSLSNVINNNDLRNQMAEKGIQRSKLFSWDIHVDKLIDLFNIFGKG